MRHFIHTESSLQSRCFLRETQRFFNAAAILKRQGKDWGRRGGKGERGGEERGEFFPLLPLFYFKPINLYQLLTRSQLSGSINVQDGGITLLPKNNHGLRCKIRPLCRPHGTVQYFRSFHTKLTNQVDFFFSFTICSFAARYSSKSKMALSSWVNKHPCNHAFTVQNVKRS